MLCTYGNEQHRTARVHRSVGGFELSVHRNQSALSPGIQRVSAFGSMHQVGLITPSAFYRVALFENDQDAQVVIAALMFVFSFSFILVILYTLYQGLN